VERYGLSGKTVLMTLGRLAPEEQYKGFDEIMELLPALSKEIPPIVYLIVGMVMIGRGWKRRRKPGGGGPGGFCRVHSEAEKADHYRLADAFVMPGRGEGFGFVF